MVLNGWKESSIVGNSRGLLLLGGKGSEPLLGFHLDLGEARPEMDCGVDSKLVQSWLRS